MFGPFGDSRVGFGFGEVFGRASERVRELRARSMEREEQGNRARREDSDTDDLINEFETAVVREAERLGREVLGPDVQMQVEFYPTNFPVSEENRYGADFGVRFHMEAQGFNITKAVLFQNKRIFGNIAAASFEQLRGDGEAQAEKMLSVTPASYFLLFNGLPVETAGEWIKPPATWIPYYEEFGPFPYPWPGLWRWAGTGRAPFNLWNTGILVLPASRVYAESRVQRQRGERLSVDARHWIRASMPLGVFMADLLGSCFVGDVREDVIKLVTPAALRALANVGVPPVAPSMLPVRRLMNVTVNG